MIKWILISAILFVVCIIFIFYLFGLKREIRNIKQELNDTKDISYNKQISVSLFDADLSDMVSEVNSNLDFQKNLKLENEQREVQMKQAISDIAHDLRTPMTVIKGNLQMLEKSLEQEEKLSEQSKEYLDICKKKTDNLKIMVDEFFELSVIESENVVVDSKKINVTEALIQFLLEQEAVIRSMDLTPKLTLPDKEVLIMADISMLNRMFGNLLNNIYKYANKEFSVSLLEFEQEGVCKIVFENRIPKDAEFDVRNMFDRTYRGDKARRSSGAGLGLYIVKLLADKQGAKVYADKQDNRLKMIIEFKLC